MPRNDNGSPQLTLCLWDPAFFSTPLLEALVVELESLTRCLNYQSGAPVQDAIHMAYEAAYKELLERGSELPYSLRDW